jgi:hypothetical protein
MDLKQITMKRIQLPIVFTLLLALLMACNVGYESADSGKPNSQLLSVKKESLLMGNR